MRRNPDVPAQPLRLDGDELNLARVLVNGQGASFRMEGEQLVHRQPARQRFELEIFTTCAPESRTPSSWACYVERRRLLHAVRGRGLPPHHLLPRPAGRDGELHRHAARRQGRLPGAAVERQPGRAGRAATTAATSRKWARPVPEAQLPVRAGGGASWWRASSASRARDGKEHLLQVYVRAGDLDKTEHAMNSLIALGASGTRRASACRSTSTAS